jgi:hypothetical protein
MKIYDGGDKLDSYMTTERDYSNDYDNDPGAEFKNDVGDHNQNLQRHTKHFHHDNDNNDNNDNDDDEVKHTAILLTIIIMMVIE